MTRGDVLPEEYRMSDIPSVIAAAHELKAPLVLIRQLALQLQEGDMSESDQEQAFARVRLTAERSFRLVDQLTKSVRLEDALFEVEPLNVREIYEDVAHQVMPLARELAQRVEVRMTGGAHTIVANRELVRNIVFSLCDNALQHNSPEFPVQLVASRASDGGIRLGVRDYGPRLAAGEFRELHSRLGKRAQPLSGRPRSSGLGLLIADTFARHMSSSLQVTRHRDLGLTFHFTMPISRQLSLLDLGL